MFLHLSVILFIGGGACVVGRCVVGGMDGRGACVEGDVYGSLGMHGR